MWITEIFFPQNDRDGLDQSKQTREVWFAWPPKHRTLLFRSFCMLRDLFFAAHCEFSKGRISQPRDVPGFVTVGTSWLLRLLLEELSQRIISMGWVRIPLGRRGHDAECSRRCPCHLNEVFSLQFIKSGQGSFLVSHFGVY